MIDRAITDLHLIPGCSYLVGDKWSDIETGRSAGCITILVMTGHGKDEFIQADGSAHYYADDLLSAVTEIIIPGLS